MHKKPLIAVLALGLLLFGTATAFATDFDPNDGVYPRASGGDAQSKGTRSVEATSGPLVTVNAGTNRTVPGMFCDGRWQGAYIYSVGDWYLGSEFYAAYQDPSNPTWWNGACAPSVPSFDVTAINAILRFSAGPYPKTFNFQPLVFGVSSTVECAIAPAPVAGGALCVGPMYAVTWTAAANYLINLPFTLECCQSGPYFAAWYGPTAGALRIGCNGGLPAPPPSPICGVFNEYGSGWDELAKYFTWTGGPYNLEHILYSEGYTPDDPATHCTPGDCDWQWHYVGDSSSCGVGPVGARNNDCWEVTYGLPSAAQGGRTKLATRFEAIGLDTLKGIEFTLYATPAAPLDILVEVYDGMGDTRACGPVPSPTLAGLRYSVVVPYASLIFGAAAPNYVPIPNITWGTLNGGLPRNLWVSISRSSGTESTSLTAYGPPIVGPACPPNPMYSVAYFPFAAFNGGVATWEYLLNVPTAYTQREFSINAFICKEQVPTCYADTDINGDGIQFTTVDLIYLTQFVSSDGPPPVPLYRADLNADGFIDYGDVEIFQCYFVHGMSCFPQYPVPVGCNPDTVRGACCEGPNCYVRSEANCERQDGLYYGDASRCDTITCIGPPPCPDDENMILNGGFLNGAIAGLMPSPGQVSDWQRWYGDPEVFTDPGCEDAVFIQLEGNKHLGDAIYQQQTIQSGHVYELQMCVRVPTASSLLDYAKLRIVASNDVTPCTEHPVPGQFVAIMDVSGKLPVCGDYWTTYISQRWKANDNFNYVAINVESNEDVLRAFVDIDNICLHEVNDSIPCYLVDMDTLGNFFDPDSLDPDCPRWDDTVDMYNGIVSYLYKNCGADNGIDTFYANTGCNDSCASIGGTIDSTVLDFDLTELCDSLAWYGLPCDAALYQMLQDVQDSLTRIVWNPYDTLVKLGALPPRCDVLPPKGGRISDDPEPFAGRDIVYVHGFRLDPMCDRIAGNPDAETTWPTNKAQFCDLDHNPNTTGYWEHGANEYWDKHTQTYLGWSADGLQDVGQLNYHNRFLVVSHPVTQFGIVGVHAILWQIREAMLHRTGVKGGQSGDTRMFGENGFVIVSHSLGSLLSSVAMSLADKSGTNAFLKLMLGDMTDVSERCDLQVSVQGAIVGSNYATLEELLLLAHPGFDGLICNLMCSGRDDCDINNEERWDLVFSQLIDMAIPQQLYGDHSPGFLKALWGTPLKDVPMHVITLAGGHPSEYGISDPRDDRKTWKQLLAKHLIHHGFDDGVVSVDGQTANSDLRFHYPNKYKPRKGLVTWVAKAIFKSNAADLLNERVFDMGIKGRRAFGYYLDQKLDVLTSSWYNGGELSWASAASIPWLSPTGMVQPVDTARYPNIPGKDALKRLSARHHSFIQSSGDHFGGATELLNNPPYPAPGYKDYFNTPADKDAPDDAALNPEEVRVFTEDLYNIVLPSGDKLVSSGMMNLQTERIRGKKIQFTIKFRIFGRTYRWSLPPIWIWKRKYHCLEDGQKRHQLDYVYKYVLQYQ